MSYAIRNAYDALALPTFSERCAMLLSVLWIVVTAQMAGDPPHGANATMLQALPWFGLMLLAWQWYGVLWKDTAADWVTLRFASLMLALAASVNAADMLARFA